MRFKLTSLLSAVTSVLVLLYFLAIVCVQPTFLYAADTRLTTLTYNVEIYFLPPNGSVKELRYQAYGNMVVKISSLYRGFAVVDVYLNISLHSYVIGYNCSLSNKLPYIKCLRNVNSVSVAQMLSRHRSISLKFRIIVNSNGNLCSINGTTIGFCPFYVYPLVLLNSSTYKEISRKFTYLGVPITGVSPVHLMYRNTTTIYLSKSEVSSANVILSMWTLGLYNRYLYVNIRNHYVVNARFVVPTKVILGKYVKLLPNALRDGIAIVYIDATYSTLRSLKRIPYNIPHYVEIVKLPSGITTTLVPSLSSTRGTTHNIISSNTTSVASSTTSSTTATSLSSVLSGSTSSSKSLVSGCSNAFFKYVAIGVCIVIASIVSWFVLRKRLGG